MQTKADKCGLIFVTFLQMSFVGVHFLV